jgi:hypothetical protein
MMLLVAVPAIVQKEVVQKEVVSGFSRTYGKSA